jgi:hypothetical protein
MKASCQSVTSQLIKVAGDFVNQYQNFRKTAAKVFVDTIIPGKSGSEKEMDKLIDQAFDLQTGLINAYGKMTGEGAGKIGARTLIIPAKKVTGDLVIERTFEVVPSPFDTVTITIKKTDGKAGADIAACAKYTNGSHYDKKERSLEKGKDKVGDTATFKFTNMANKLLTIHLVKEGFPTDTCNYTLSIEGEFNKAEMQKVDADRSTQGAVRTVE